MDNKPLIAIVGPSGSGKSSSLETLLKNNPPGEVIILDIEQKGFPFRVNGTPYEKFIIKCNEASEVEHHLRTALKNPIVKIVVVESFTKYAERLATVCKACYKNYEIWSQYNDTILNILNASKSITHTVVWTAIPEVLKIPQTDASEKACSRIKVQGKVLEGLIEKEFLLVLYTEPRKTSIGKMEYNFVTNSDGINSAKTPAYLGFPLLIPNDLNEVIKKLQ